MMQDTTRNRKLLAGVAGVTLALGVAVSAGAMPRPGDDTAVKTVAASAQIVPVPASPARQPGDAAASTAPATTLAPTAAPLTTGPPTTVAKAATATTKATSPARSAAAPAAAQPSSPAAAAPSAAAPVAAAVAKVARRVPLPAEVSAAIAALPQYVHSILTPTPAQVAQLGDQVCTAFDQGQTAAQVEATGLQMVTKVPLTTVLPGGAAWVAETAVTLYCPGYTSKF
jgi:hypothetical protein